MKPNIKKLLILNAPYLLFVWLFMKIGEAFRLSPGADLSGKLLHIMVGVTAAFESPMPSLNGQDFLVGVAGAVILRLAVYMKGKNAQKYRKGVEYGSARWGNAKDIEPYIIMCMGCLIRFWLAFHFWDFSTLNFQRFFYKGFACLP